MIVILLEWLIGLSLFALGARQAERQRSGWQGIPFGFLLVLHASVRLVGWLEQ